MKIENQLEKEFSIFQKLGDKCTREDYLHEFNVLYPDDIKGLFEKFESQYEHGKDIEKCVKKYMRESFVKGRLRFRITMGIDDYAPRLKNI